MTYDTSQTLTFEQSTKQLAVYVLGSLVFVAMGLWFVFGDLGITKIIAVPLGIVTILLFGAFGVIGLTRMLGGDRPIVTLSPEGIIDTRVSADLIPWSAVNAIGTWTMQRQQVMVVEVDPTFESTITLTRIAKMTRKANAQMGADGLCITAQGLKIGHEALVTAAMAYVDAHVTPDGGS